MVDTTTAENHDLVVGETYSISGPVEQRRFRLVGVFNFGSPDVNTTVGQTMSAFDLATAQDFLGYEPDELNSIGVLLEPGLDPEIGRRRVQDALGDGHEVVTQETSTQEVQDSFNSFIDIFNNVLLAFALIAVFVSAFIINNTFQIILGQRVRELGLLRALGATGKQVSRSVILEAAIVGLASTLLGILLGVGLGGLLKSLLNGLGFSLPGGPTELRPRTVIVAGVLGMGVTFLSALSPARRARRISPIAAMQAGTQLTPQGLTRRLIVGGVITTVGGLLMALGLFGGLDTVATLANIAIGAVLVFIGVTVISPSFARPVTNALGRWPAAVALGLFAPLSLFTLTRGIVGGAPGTILLGALALPVAWLAVDGARAFRKVPARVAGDNAGRTPRRTSSTAAALMIGLALVSMAAIVGESIKATFRDTFDNAVAADYAVQSTAGNFGVGFAEEVADRIAVLDEIDTVVRYRFAFQSMEVAGSEKDITAADFAGVERHIDADLVAGSISATDPLTGIAIHEDPAEDLGVGVGDTLEVTFPDGGTETLTVGAVYSDSSVLGNWVIDNALWTEHFNRSDVSFVSANIEGFSDELPAEEQAVLLERSQAALDAALTDFPSVKVENRVEFRQSQQDQLDSVLAVITVFLVLALFIALIGITNTLALSVFGRTREIGLLRAVGMTRRQTRRMIRWEAAVIGLFGGLLGIVLGVVFGVAATVAIPDTFVATASIPWSTLVTYLFVATGAGLIASVLPAWRAARMNVLEAISHE
ncbi:MAG: ABC transporter permease [Acidimicrobiales bacterium]